MSSPFHKALLFFIQKMKGIDGYFTDGLVGCSIDVKILDFLNFKEKVESILKDYYQISDNCIDESKSFHWTGISKRYIKIYNSLMMICAEYLELYKEAIKQ